MATRTIEVPSFNFSSFYYPQILEALIQFKRQNVPELTDESDFEPSMQLLRAYALVGHLNNALADLVANECTLPTSRLQETVRNMLRLIDFELRASTPSSVDIVYELSKVFTVPTLYIAAESRSATRQDGVNPVIFFEVLEDLNIAATDEFTAVRASDGGVFSDHTASANGGVNFVPWATPASGDALYFGHADVMWNLLNIDVVVAAINIVGIWEFYDGDKQDVEPTSVTNIGGGQLEFDLTSLLGINDRRGTIVRVTLNSTGVFEEVTSAWNGSQNVAVTALIGQSSPSVDETDYTVGTDWTEFAAVDTTFSDGTTGLTVDGDVEYALPQAELLNWRKTAVDSVEAFWVRFRIITTSTPTSPTLNLCRLDTGKQFVIVTGVQGRTVSDDPLGSSDGTASQEFETSRDHFINESQTVTVDAEIWTPVKNFLSSGPQDKHYVVELGENDRATIVFGDGVAGKIPPVGVGNISIDYRFNAEEDGNVGAGKIEIDSSGVSFVNRLFNPRQASGWAPAQGSTEESLEQAKEEGPASIRIQEVALGPGDVIKLATDRFTASDGTKPFGRGFVVEEGFGEKTMKLVLVGKGGGIPSSGHLAELDVFLNGDKFSIPPKPKRIVANTQAISVSFDPKAIDLAATVEAPSSIAAQQIQNRLAEVLQPEALKEDGVTFEWEFGGTIPLSRLIHEIFKTDERIKKVTITSPLADIVLAVDQLPVAGTFTITMLVI